jgi:Mn-dependent DtxR family transcriptional regulator
MDRVNKTYFSKVIRNLHKARLIEASEAGTVRLLPPGTADASRIISNHKKG